jgi:ketosteroid isomerase-like protein
LISGQATAAGLYALRSGRSTIGCEEVEIMLGAILAKREARKAFDALIRHDLDALMGAFHEDGVFEFPGETVLGGSFHGKQEIRGWFEHWWERMPVTRFTLRHVSVENIFALGGTNTVSVEWDLDERDTEGHSYSLTGITRLEVVGGKARHVKDYIFDQHVLEGIWPKKTTTVV